MRAGTGLPRGAVFGAKWGERRVLLGLISLALAAVLLTLPCSLQATERRKPQFPTEPSYLIVPLPYSLPGIGTGIIVTGLLGNVAETNVDLFGLIVTGDAEGSIIGLEDIHIVSETLILNLFWQDITKALVNNYETRGMNSDPDDFTLIELTEVRTLAADLTLTFFDRRFELFAGIQTQDIEIPRIRDKDGNVILELSPPFTSSSENTFFGIRLDLTDDRQDPRTGVRLSAVRSSSPRDDPDDAEFFVWDYSATFYLSVGRISTLALHYFQSDAEVTAQGTTDPAAIRAELGFACPPADQECLETEAEIVDRGRAAALLSAKSLPGSAHRLLRAGVPLEPERGGDPVRLLRLEGCAHRCASGFLCRDGQRGRDAGRGGRDLPFDLRCGFSAGFRLRFRLSRRPCHGR
jgi:hypothetical protein